MTKAMDPGKSLGKRAKKGAVWAFVRESGSELLLFPASMVLARLLSPEEFGIAAAAGFFTLLAGQLSGLGLNAALVRIKDLRPEHSSSVFVVNIVVGLLMFGVLFTCAPLIGRFYNTPETSEVVRVAALAFIIGPLGTVPGAMLNREMRFRESALSDWYHLAVFAGVSVVLAWWGFSYMSMVYGRVAGSAAFTIARMYYAPWQPSLRFSSAAMREILPFGAGMHAKRLLDYAARNLDNLVVGKLYGMATLGIYDKAFSTMNRLLTRMSIGGSGVMFRIFSIIHEEPARFVAAYRKVLMSTTLLAFPVFAGLIAVAPQFITVLFGGSWRAAAMPFQILCVGGCLKLLNRFASTATQATGHVWGEVWRQTLYVALIVGGLFVLRPWGPVGAATAVLLATVVMTVLMHALLTNVTGLRLRHIGSALVPALSCAAGTACIALLVEYGLRQTNRPPGELLLLVCQAAAAAVFYIAFVLLFPHVELRLLVTEFLADLTPPFVKRQAWFRWFLRVTSHDLVTSRSG